MTVQDTIKKVMSVYPSIAPSRVQVLHHLFWVIGNGYEWKDGELVTLFSEDYEKKPLIPSSPALEAYDRVYAALGKFIEATPDYIDVVRIPLATVYPLCEYSKILCIPEDVKDDWLDAAMESLQDVEEYNKRHRGDLVLSRDDEVGGFIQEASTAIAVRNTKERQNARAERFLEKFKAERGLS